MSKTRLLLLVSVLLIFTSSLIAQDDLDFSGGSNFEPCQALQNTTLFKPLGEISTVLESDTDEELLTPPDCAGSFFQSRLAGQETRFGSVTPYHWKPTNFFRHPVYFDDVPLERYGQSKSPHFQPFISGTRFILQLPILPYRMGVDPPLSCVSSLGHQPPGSCVPCIRQTLPIQGNASLVQAATTVGLVFLLP